MNDPLPHSRAWMPLLCLIFILCLPTGAGAERIVAPSGAEFVSIQDAIDWSAPYETVIVQSGIYLENVQLTKPINLKGVDTGAGVPVISPGNRDPAVVILASGCTVEGFTVRNSAEASGIRITSANNTIQKNTIRKNGIGIVLVGANSNVIRQNEIAENEKSGIVLERSGSNLIDNNKVIRNPLGISLDEESLANTIQRNNFLNTRNALSRSLTSTFSSQHPYSYRYLGKDHVSPLGNYWNDYTGKDSNGDGIGDSTYPVTVGVVQEPASGQSQNGMDTFPLMDPMEYYSSVVSSTETPLHTSMPTGSPTGSLTPAPPVTGDSGVPFPPIPPAVTPLALGLVLLVVLLLLVGGAYYLKRPGTAPPPHDEPETPQTDFEGSRRDVVSKAASALKNAVDKTRSLVTLPSLRTVLSDADDSGPKPSVTDQKNYFPRELENKYTDITFIGRGGIAWVFSAIRKSDGTKVAVKIPISFDEVTGKCFLNEIAAWETLRHKNIVEVTAVNILPVPYVEMEFVPGSLEALDKPLPVWKAVHLMTLVADGLRYAHEHGFIHRDIKPHNILLTDDLVPKITDWGMSKVLASDVKKSSVAGFSLSYAAPEQVSPSEFGRTGQQTDIYQLGVVFYELVTGSIPFGGESIVEVGNAILRETPTPPSAYNPDAAAVEKIILKCLEKDPAHRYRSAAELHTALQGYLDEEDE